MYASIHASTAVNNDSAGIPQAYRRHTYRRHTAGICEQGFRVHCRLGASVAKWLAHLPFTSEAAGSSLSENFLNATRTQSSCEKSKSQRSAESRGFPPGTPVSSHRES